MTAAEAPIAVSSESPRQKFISNFFGGSVRGVVYTATVFWSIPLLVKGLGAESFGQFAILSMFLRLGYYGAFDFGLSIAVTRYAAAARATGRQDEIRRLMTAAFITYLTIAVVLIAGFSVVGQPLINAFHRGAMDSTALFHAFQLGVLAYCLYLVSNTFFALLTAHPGFHVTHWIGTGTTLAEVAGVTALYFTHITLMRLFALHASIGALALIATFAVARRSYPELWFSFSDLRWSTFRDLVSYGLKLGFVSASSYTMNFYDKLILGYFCGVAAIGQYEAAMRVIELLRRVPQMIFLPLLPVSSELRSCSDDRSISALYAKSLRILLVISLPIFVACGLSAVPFIALWLGPGYKAAGAAMAVFAVAYLINAATLAAGQIFTGIGRLRPVVKSAAFALVACVVLDPLGARLYGFYGAVIASALTVSFGGVYLLVMVHKSPGFRIGFNAIRWAILVGFTAGLLAGVPALVLYSSATVVRILVLAVVLVSVSAVAGTASGRGAVRELFALLRKASQVEREPQGEAPARA